MRKAHARLQIETGMPPKGLNLHPECPGCAQQLRFPPGKAVVAKCPRCGTEMEWAPGSGFLWFTKPADSASSPTSPPPQRSRKSAAKNGRKPAPKSPTGHRKAARKQSASIQPSPAPSRPDGKKRRGRGKTAFVLLVITGALTAAVFFSREEGLFPLPRRAPPPLEIAVDPAAKIARARAFEAEGRLEAAVETVAGEALAAILAGNLDATDQLITSLQDFGGLSGKTVLGEDIFTIPGLNLKMIRIPRGTYTVGSPEDEPGRNTDEIQKPFALREALWVAATEVTYRQWEGLTGQAYGDLYISAQPDPTAYESRSDEGGRTTYKAIPAASADQPAAFVSWAQAADFCVQLTRRERAAGRIPESYAYQLPGEYEWEVACRAETNGPFAGNRDAMTRYATGRYNRSNPVASLAPNRWGFYDMHGNLWEWCQDEYSGGARRAVRGGSYRSPFADCRSANRSGQDPAVRNAATGFRIALKRSE
jgi:formylglycine-generating enzyme required for sulfatase activity